VVAVPSRPKLFREGTMVNKPRVHELAEGQYVVLGDTWIVGKRYKIQSVIGKGSYGAVRSAASV